MSMIQLLLVLGLAFVFLVSTKEMSNLHVDVTQNTVFVSPHLDACVYQSALNQTIFISGGGFTTDIKLIFSPPLQINVDYTMQVMAEDRVEMYLREDKMWRATPGPILVYKIETGTNEYVLNQQVVNVLADPYIVPSSVAVHESRTRQVNITLSGVSNLKKLSKLKIELLPTSERAYHTGSVHEDTVTLQLTDNSWLHSAQTLTKGKQVGLTVASVDTGAGRVVYDTPVKVGCIVRDGEDLTCDADTGDDPATRTFSMYRP